MLQQVRARVRFSSAPPPRPSVIVILWIISRPLITCDAVRSAMSGRFALAGGCVLCLTSCLPRFQLCATNLPPCLFDHTPPGVFDGQGSGHDFYGVSFPQTCDGVCLGHNRCRVCLCDAVLRCPNTRWYCCIGSVFVCHHHSSTKQTGASMCSRTLCPPENESFTSREP